MLLAIDRGNTNDKFVVFDNDKIILESSKIQWHFTKFFSEKKKLISEINLLFSEKNLKISDCIFSSVKSEQDNKEFTDIISQYYNVRQLTYTTPLPIQNMYQSNTLGMDRLAAVVGANALLGSNVLVVDAGTCITFDYLDKDKRYLGGSISPGFKIKYEALHNFTANLPLINGIDEVNLVGNNTKDSIRSGVINGTIAEIEQTINLYKQRFFDVKIVITGGDSSFIKSKIGCNVTEEKNLVFWGLKNIYEFNEKSNK
ncbi:MAG: type III pantothenate kinase [Bacteroidales bacterium]|nr:type III pantothenate kinase [Bacteroidales bacterium]